MDDEDTMGHVLAAKEIGGSNSLSRPICKPHNPVPIGPGETQYQITGPMHGYGRRGVRW